VKYHHHVTAATSVYDRLLEIALLLQRDLAQSFDGTDLTTARTHLLWAVHHQGPSTQQALAVALDVSPRNVTGLVDALEQTGYVERRPHPRDRRAALVTLTELGVQTMEQMVRDRQQAAAHLVAGLSHRQLTDLDEHLALVGERLRTMIEQATSSQPVDVP
jgi:DNA-binding MarR family transcriptional regulator